MAEVVKKNLFFSREKYKVFLSFMGKECYNNYQKIVRESKDPCGSRQMDMQACPLGSLLAGIHIGNVKQNRRGMLGFTVDWCS